MLPKIPTIYCIRNTINDKKYIGSTKNYRKRITNHLHNLRKGKHHSYLLQQAWKSYGEEVFEFLILELLTDVSIENIILKENYWIEHYRSFDRNYGYNICKQAYTFKGEKFPIDIRNKISEQKKIAYNTPEYKEACRQRNLGKVLSKEHKENIRKGNKGKTSFNIENATIAKYKSVAKIDEEGNILDTYKSLKECSEMNQITEHNVWEHCSKKLKKTKYIYL